MGDFLKVQPSACREPLTYKELEVDKYIKTWHLRTLFLDPFEIYERVHEVLDPFARRQKIPMRVLFPPILAPICDCGCGQELKEWATNKRRRWARNECGEFVVQVWGIISGHPGIISGLMWRYFNESCIDCGSVEGLEVDHVIPVKHGGGGCWLSNYRYRCTQCHRIKTNKDFGFKEFRYPNQLSLQL